MKCTLNHSCLKPNADQWYALVAAALSLGFLALLTSGCSETSPSLKPLRVEAKASRLHELSHEIGPVSLRLHCGNAGLTTEQVSVIRAKLPQLQGLSLTYANVDQQTAIEIARINTLRSLSLRNGSVTSESLQTIFDALDLHRLFLTDPTGFDDSGISAIANETELEELALTHMTGLSGNSLHELGALANLTSLSISADFQVHGPYQYPKGPPISIHGNWLVSLPELDSLVFTKCELDSEAQQAIGSLTKLSELQLRDTNADDTTLSHVAKLKSLKVLNIKNSNVTDVGIAELSGFSFKHLDISSTLITDDGLDALRKNKIQSLNRSRTYITTDATYRFIKAMRENGVNVRVTGGSFSHYVDVDTGQTVRGLPVSPYRGSLVSGYYLYGASLVDLTKPARIRILDFLEFGNPIQRAQLASDAKHVALPVGRDKIQVYRTDTGEKVFAIEKSMMRDGDNFVKNRFAVYPTEYGGLANVWDIKKQTQVKLRSNNRQGSSPSSIQLSPDGRRVLVEQFPYSYLNSEKRKDDNANFLLFDARTAKLLDTFLATRASFTTNRGEIVRVTETPSRSRFVVQNAGGATLKIDSSWADSKHRSFEVSPDGRRLLVCSDGKGILYDTSTGKVVHEIADPFKQNESMYFMPDGNVIVGQLGKY